MAKILFVFLSGLRRFVSTLAFIFLITFCVPGMAKVEGRCLREVKIQNLAAFLLKNDVQQAINNPVIQKLFKDINLFDAEGFLSLEDGREAELKRLIEENPILAQIILKKIFEKPSLIEFQLLVEKILFNLQRKTVKKVSVFPNEQTIYAGTTLEVVREIMRQVEFKPDDVVIDLGSGLGAFVFPVALLKEVKKVVGVEIFPEFVAHNKNIKKRLGLKNLEIREANVRERTDVFQDGTLFYMYQPFGEETFAVVADRLNQIARERRIRIISYGQPSWINNSKLISQEFLKFEKSFLTSMGPFTLIVSKTGIPEASKTEKVLKSA